MEEMVSEIQNFSLQNVPSFAKESHIDIVHLQAIIEYNPQDILNEFSTMSDHQLQS